MNPVDRLLREHFDDPYHCGECDQPTHAAELQLSDVQTVSARTRDASLGDSLDAAVEQVRNNCELLIELRIGSSSDGDGVVDEAWFSGAGCEICEALASVLCEQSEGVPVSQLSSWTLTNVLEKAKANYQGPQEIPQDAIVDWLRETNAACRSLPLAALQQALDNDLDHLDDDLVDGASFGGPSLREEC